MSRSADARRTPEIPRFVAAHRRPSRTVLFVAALALGALPVPPGPAVVGPATLLAQDAPKVQAGRLVRVDAPRYGLDSRIAVVREVGGGGLLLAFDDGATLHVEADAMRRLDLHTGTGNHGVSGFFLGVLGGAVTGVVSGIASGDDPPCELPPPGPGFGAGLGAAIAHSFCEQGRQSSGEKAGQRAVLYGLAGGAIGFAIGRVIDFDRWTEVDVGSTTVTVEPTVTGSGAGLVVSLPLRSP